MRIDVPQNTVRSSETHDFAAANAASCCCEAEVSGRFRSVLEKLISRIEQMIDVDCASNADSEERRSENQKLGAETQEGPASTFGPDMFASPDSSRLSALMAASPMSAHADKSSFSPGALPGSLIQSTGGRFTFNVTTPDGKTSLIDEAVRTPNPYVGINKAGELVFHAPVKGETTPNSQYTRSELRETLKDGSLHNWNPFKGGHELEGRASVIALPSGGRTTFAQIHGKDNNHPPVKLMFASTGGGSGQIYVEYRPQNGSKVVRKTLLDNVRLGEKFAYRLSARNGQVTLQVSGGGSSNALNFVLDKGWEGTEFYFKAGAYNTGTARNGKGASTIAHSGLRISHT